MDPVLCKGYLEDPAKENYIVTEVVEGLITANEVGRRACIGFSDVNKQINDQTATTSNKSDSQIVAAIKSTCAAAASSVGLANVDVDFAKRMSIISNANYLSSGGNDSVENYAFQKTDDHVLKA